MIDEINILQATYRAMKQAVDGLTRPADFVYVDGNRSQGLEQPHECVVSGDAQKSHPLRQRPFIAKVTRDRLMRRYRRSSTRQYAFEKHKGYEHQGARCGTARARPHARFDRMTFLQASSTNSTRSATAVNRGQRREKTLAAAVPRNDSGWHTCSCDEFPHPVRRAGHRRRAAHGYLIFAEVKTAQEYARYGTPGEAVTAGQAGAD